MSGSFEDRLRSLAGKRPPGIAAAVVRPDGVEAAAGAGSADLARGVDAAPEMVCPWFSMTKIVSATAAMRLVDRGVLDLDEPLLRYVPQLARLRPAASASAITGRQLLTHSAGLANPIPLGWIHAAGAPAVDQGAFLDRLLAKHSKLRFEPGTKSSYSNLSTLALGVAMTALAGDSFPDIVQREVLDPVEMTMTRFAYTEEMESRAAVGYHPRWSPMRFLLPRWVRGEAVGRWLSLRRFLLDGQAYGGLVGSLEDAARFLQLHLVDGAFGGRQVLQPETARTMREIVLPGRRFDLGLGWFRPAKHRRDDPAFVEHLGGGAGFFNVIRAYPARSVGIAVMGNATKYDIDAVPGLALDLGTA
ncbi:MAG TPA: serine hydrolase domain-containing protein [Gaiellaceae bacterium]|nr:serine hydrolase domain-containing protein [Gaiellaceae bacterium]